MRWWARGRLRTKIFLAFSALILALLLLTLGFVQLAVSRQVQSTLKEELLTTGHVFQGLVAERATRLLTNTILLAGDFALKRAIATYDPSTLASVALNYQERVGVDLLWITDEAGVLLQTHVARSRVAERSQRFPRWRKPSPQEKRPRPLRRLMACSFSSLLSLFSAPMSLAFSC